MKRFSRISVFLIFVLVLTSMLLAACGGGAAPAKPVEPTAPPEEPTTAPVEEPPAEEPTKAPAEEPATDSDETPTLKVWADEIRSPIIEELGKSFLEEYGVGIKVQLVGFGDIREQFQVAGPAGEGPDIIIGAHDWLGELVNSGLLAPVDLGDKKDDFLSTAIQGFTYENKLYGMPYAVENVAFFRNTDLVPDAPETWSDVTVIAEELEADDKVKMGFGMHEGDAFHFFPIQTAFGGYVFGVNDQGYNAEDVGIDSEGSIASVEWLEMMVKEGHMQPGIDWDTIHTMFESGDVAMFITGPWALERIRESGIPYAVSKIPSETESSKPFLGVQGFMVSAFSEDPVLAQVFLTEFVATEEVMQKFFDADPRPPAFNAVVAKVDDPDLAAISEAGKEGLPMPAIPAMGAVWGSWGDALTLVFQEQQGAEEAFTNAAKQVREAIAEQ